MEATTKEASHSVLGDELEQIRFRLYRLRQLVISGAFSGLSYRELQLVSSDSSEVKQLKVWCHFLLWDEDFDLLFTQDVLHRHKTGRLLPENRPVFITRLKVYKHGKMSKLWLIIEHKWIVWSNLPATVVGGVVLRHEFWLKRDENAADSIEEN